MRFDVFGDNAPADATPKSRAKVRDRTAVDLDVESDDEGAEEDYHGGEEGSEYDETDALSGYDDLLGGQYDDESDVGDYEEEAEGEVDADEKESESEE
jgi:hypothetical protein